MVDSFKLFKGYQGYRDTILPNELHIKLVNQLIGNGLDNIRLQTRQTSDHDDDDNDEYVTSPSGFFIDLITTQRIE